MKSLTLAASWSLVILAVAAQIQWKQCPELVGTATNPQFQCANLTVPLDYQNNNSKPLNLNLLRFAAPKQPARGSILFNPGGPGVAGRNVLYGLSGLVAAVTGNEHDIVTWDPRGTGVTLPVSCYTNPSDRASGDSFNLNSSDASISAGWKHAKGVASACKTALAASGELLGTTYVARDMVQIIDALGEDGLLRYYGASYGTALGQVFAGMFPAKVDKMVLDGVVNLRQYLAGRDIQNLAATEAVWEGFLSACLSRPSLCPLAEQSTSTENLRQQIDSLFDRLHAHPLSLGPTTADQLTASALKTDIFQLLYNATQWPELSSALDLLLSPTSDSTAVLGKILNGQSGSAPPPFPEEQEPEVNQAIKCSDTLFRTEDESQVRPIVQAVFRQTERFANYLAFGWTLTCPQWPFRAKEQFTRHDFDVQLKTPMLLIGNVYDPVTALDGARNASATWKSSVLLVQEGYGHTSLSQLSRCKTTAVSNYFNLGKLPVSETVCLVDTPTFATAEELIAAAAEM